MLVLKSVALFALIDVWRELTFSKKNEEVYMSPRRPMSEGLTREMILKEAHTQFINNGYYRVSMRQIAKQLNCSHGAIYYHFKNKADLFYAVIEQYFQTLQEIILDIVSRPEDDDNKLHQLMLSFISFGLNNQSQYELMFMIRNTEVDGLSQEAANVCYETFAQAVNKLCPSPVQISDLYSTFLSLHGFVAHYLGYVERFEDVQDTAQLHVRFLVKALGSSK